MDRYTNRQTMLYALTTGIKTDIREMLEELKYGNCGKFAQFMWTCKPDRFQSVGIKYGALCFRDNYGTEWHSDNVTDVNELLSILKAMHHILPCE